MTVPAIGDRSGNNWVTVRSYLADMTHRSGLVRYAPLASQRRSGYRRRNRHRAECTRSSGGCQIAGQPAPATAAASEPVLQALVRHGILKGIRGPRGGYELAREQRRITVDDILRAADTAEDANDVPHTETSLLSKIVIPALAQAEQVFSTALARINIEELARSAEAVGAK